MQLERWRDTVELSSQRQWSYHRRMCRHGQLSKNLAYNFIGSAPNPFSTWLHVAVRCCWSKSIHSFFAASSVFTYIRIAVAVDLTKPGMGFSPICSDAKTKPSWLCIQYSLFCFHIRILIQGYLFIAPILVSSWAHLRVLTSSLYRGRLLSTMRIVVAHDQRCPCETRFCFPAREAQNLSNRKTHSKLLCHAVSRCGAYGQFRGPDTYTHSVMQRIRRN